MICKKCNAVMDDDSLFCNRCGAAVENEPTVCKSCGTPLAENALFCKKCGTQVNKNNDSQKSDTSLNNTQSKIHNRNRRKSTEKQDTSNPFGRTRLSQLSEEEIKQKLNVSVTMINEWSELDKEVRRLNARLDEVRKILPKNEFFLKYPEKKSTVLHVVADIFLAIFVLPVLAMLLGNLLGETFGAIFSIFGFLHLNFLPLVIGGILAVIAHVQENNEYTQYVSRCNEINRTVSPEYKKKSEELKKLEEKLDDIEICVIPRSYWKHAQAIAYSVQSGDSQTIQDAITKLRLKPER